MPPFRLAAPAPISPFSKITTMRPARASVKAADRPANPAPIMTVSTNVGGLKISLFCWLSMVAFRAAKGAPSRQ